MKKNLLIFITLLFFESSVFAEDSKVIDLDYWVPFSGGDARPMQLMVDKFNTLHPKINIKMNILRWEDYYDVLNSSLKSHNTPDVAIVHASLVRSYVTKDLLHDLDGYDIDWGNFSTYAQNNVTFNKKHFALPLDSHPQVLFFNKKYLKAAGLLDNKDEPIIKAGLNGFLDFLKQLQKSLPRNIRVLSSGNDNIYPFWIWYSLYKQQIGSPDYIKGNRANLNNVYAKNALEVLKAIRESGVWNEEIHDEKGYNLFKYNNAATMITGTWATWNFEQNKELDFGVTLFPRMFDKDASYGDSHTFVIPKATSPQKAHAATEFINWISLNSFNWALSGQVPANIDVSNSQEFKALPHRDIYEKAVQAMCYYPKDERIGEVNTLLKEILLSFMKSNMPVEQTLKMAESKVNTLLGRP